MYSNVINKMKRAFNFLELLNALQDQRLPDGTTENVGQVLLNWVRQVIYLFVVKSLSLVNTGNERQFVTSRGMPSVIPFVVL